MPGTMISRGNILYSFIIQVSLVPVAVAGNTTADQNFIVPGVQANDQISSFSFQGAITNQDVSVVNARVSAANTLTIAYQNGAGGALTPQAGNYLIEINRLEASSYSALPATAI